MNLDKISPLTSYQSLFGDAEVFEPVNQEVFTEAILIGELEQYLYSENNSAIIPYPVQRKKIKDLVFKLFELKPLAEEFIPYLAWIILKFGQSNLSQKFTSLIPTATAVEISERYYRMVVKEGSFLSGKDGVDIARLKLQSENQVFECFFEMRSRVKEILGLKIEGQKLEVEIKNLEKKNQRYESPDQIHAINSIFSGRIKSDIESIWRI